MGIGLLLLLMDGEVGMGDLYEQRDIEAQEDYYMKHLSAMTGEKLHRKSDIAAELAHRDMVIDGLKEDLGLKDHEIRELVTRVTVAVRVLSDSLPGCLREVVSREVVGYLEEINRRKEHG